MSKTLYDIVGVPRDATHETIAAAAQARMDAIKQAHEKGDANAATDSFALKEAFAVLRDAGKRAAYDDKLNLKAGLSLAPGPAADPLVKTEAILKSDEAKSGDLIVYRDGEKPDSDGDPIKQFGTLIATAIAIAVFVGFRAYRAEVNKLDRQTTESIASFNSSAWIKTLGPAKPVVEEEEEPDPPKPFTLEGHQQEQEQRDAEVRRRMERERRDYDRARQREQYEDQARAQRGY